MKIDRGADIMVRTTDGSLPIHIAASKGNIALMKLLLSAGEEKFIKRKNQIVEPNYTGATVLHRAVQCNQYKVFDVRL